MAKCRKEQNLCKELEKFMTKFNDNIVYHNSRGHHPLHAAILEGNIRILHLLLNNLQGADDLNVKDHDGNTPLLVSTRCTYDHGLYTKLLDLGADIEATNDAPETPLLSAFKFGNEIAVELLLQRGANVKVKDIYGNSMLHLSIQDKYSENTCLNWVKYLIDQGLNVNLKGMMGLMPLHFAAMYKYSSIVKLLLENGAEISAKNALNDTPLHTCIRYFNSSKYVACERTMQELLDWGALDDVIDQQGMPSDITSNCPCVQQVMKQTAFKLQSVNLECRVKHDFSFDVSDSFTYACLTEVESMKNIQIGSRLLYHVFSGYSDPGYVMNAKLIDFVESPDLCESFPMYASLLKATLKKAERRYDLLNQAVRCIASFNLPVNLPHEVLRKILSHVGNEDLTSVIETLSAYEVSP